MDVAENVSAELSLGRRWWRNGHNFTLIEEVFDKRYKNYLFRMNSSTIVDPSNIFRWLFSLKVMKIGTWIRHPFLTGLSSIEGADWVKDGFDRFKSKGIVEKWVWSKIPSWILSIFGSNLSAIPHRVLPALVPLCRNIPPVNHVFQDWLPWTHECQKQITCYRWPATDDLLYMICYRWHAKHDMLQVACYMWHASYCDFRSLSDA